MVLMGRKCYGVTGVKNLHYGGHNFVAAAGVGYAYDWYGKHWYAVKGHQKLKDSEVLLRCCSLAPNMEWSCESIVCGCGQYGGSVIPQLY